MGYQKSKNATMERAGKGFLRLLSGRKRVHFFRQGVLRENVRERAMPERKAEKGLLHKISANNLYQRKLL
jgi:hypothetical protein